MLTRLTLAWITSTAALVLLAAVLVILARGQHARHAAAIAAQGRTIERLAERIERLEARPAVDDESPARIVPNGDNPPQP